MRSLLNKQPQGTLVPKAYRAAFEYSFNNTMASRVLPIKGVRPGSSTSPAMVEKLSESRVINVTIRHQGRKQRRFGSRRELKGASGSSEVRDEWDTDS